MVFWLQIQADHGSEMLQNIYPDGKRTGGNAVLAFLVGLETYSTWNETKQDSYPELKAVVTWCRKLEILASASIFPICRALLDCDWSDCGDPTRWREDEYEFYKHRMGDNLTTEEQFLAMVRDYDKHWQPIDKVMQGVRLLLDMFNRVNIEPLEGFYVPEDTIPDFEAFYYNLELLKKRGCQDIRLNFT
jgi:hypothetical protein